MELQGSKTEENLLAAFAGESQARNRYSYAAAKAKKEGLIQVSRIFEETSEQERVHAKNFFRFLKGGVVEITASFPAGVIGSSVENLEAAAAGEHMEWSELYPGFAAVAHEEGFDAVAGKFEAVAIAEKLHERRYLGLLANLKNDATFNKESPVVWYCAKCGYVHEGLEAPKVCPACAHPRGYFEILSENW
jgi:rubrerythrin